MTIAELIERLQKLDPTAGVFVLDEGLDSVFTLNEVETLNEAQRQYYTRGRSSAVVLSNGGMGEM